MIEDFVPIARAILGLTRPEDHHLRPPSRRTFLACNAPIKALYDLGVDVEENSELDLLVAYNEHADDPRIPAKMRGNGGGAGRAATTTPGILPRLAQYELTLLDWAEAAQGRPPVRGLRQQVLACLPDRVRLRALLCQQPPDRAWASHVSCEVDIYGALSEYIGICVSGDACDPAGHQQHRARRPCMTRSIKGKYDYRLNGDLHGLPLRQHALLPTC